MNCPACQGEMSYLPGNVLLRCDNCGYLVEAAAWGIHEPYNPAPSGLAQTRFEYSILKLMESFSRFLGF